MKGTTQNGLTHEIVSLLSTQYYQYIEVCCLFLTWDSRNGSKEEREVGSGECGWPVAGRVGGRCCGDAKGVSKNNSDTLKR